MQDRLIAHVLAPQTWIPQANGDIHVARFHQQRIEPTSQFVQSDYTDSLSGRLMLLNDAEWKLLGFAVAVCPYSGQIGTSINGKFRKAVKSRFEQATVDQLDALNPREAASRIGAHQWADVEEVALMGIASIRQWASLTDAQNRILDVRFKATEVATQNMTEELMEELCKISLPNLLWLWDYPASDLHQAPLN